MGYRIKREQRDYLNRYHGEDVAPLICALADSQSGMKHRPAKVRALAALDVLRRYCKAAGMDPDCETFMVQERRGVWRISWESGPFDWAIPASFAMFETGQRLIEPYHGFDLMFYAGE